jgi:Raf kinase inhibitor-like YbhB/YbcL family protein
MNWQKQLVFIVGMVAVMSLISVLAAFSRRMFKKEHEKIAFTLTSPAYENHELIPPFYTCDGHDVSPPLVWENPPVGTQSFVLVFHDPGALGGDWVHWVVYDIPKETKKLAEHAVVESIGAKTALNSWDSDTYGGPCPPLNEHTYIFTLYALDIPHLAVKLPVTQKAVMQAMEGHIIDQAMIKGFYQRTKTI